MDFNAKQMREDALIQKGRYQFFVARATEKTTKSGDAMMSLKLTLIYNNRNVSMWSNLLCTPAMFWQVEHFCKSVGLENKLEEGRLMAMDCDNRTGLCDIEHRTNKETGEVEAYIKDYIKEENENTEQSGFLDDDIPL